MSSPISGFTAIPNPQMLAFMPIQSYLMMYFAGSGWQYGKRKISAMSNEQFNKLTPEELLQQHSIELKNMLPTLEKSLNDVTPLVRILIEQYGDFIKEAIKAIPPAVGTAVTGLQEQLFPKSPGSIYDMVKHWLEDENIPDYLKAEAHEALKKIDLTTTSNRGFTTGGSQAIDFGGQSLAEFNRLKKEESARLVSAKANRPKQVQVFNKLFGKSLVPQVRVDVTKRKAGQSAILERAKLISTIANYGQIIKRKDITLAKKKQWIERLKPIEQKLVNLLARYRF